jgi:SAM-dependent methyltransferase
MTLWDSRHRQASGDERPSSLVVELTTPLKPGLALDLACGTGRNALWLAEKGWDVTAVDFSETALEILRERAAAHDLGVTTQHANIETQEYLIEPLWWDLILIWNYLQRDLYPVALDGLVTGGLLIASALLGDPEQRFRVAPGELPTYFERCCEVIHYREITANRADGTAEIAVRKR